MIHKTCKQPVRYVTEQNYFGLDHSTYQETYLYCDDCKVEVGYKELIIGEAA